MRLVDALRGTVGRVDLTPADERARRQGEELIRRRRLYFAEGSNWPRLDLAELAFHRHHVEHTPTGERYRIIRGEVMDARFSPAVAWFIGNDGGPVFLEPA